MTSLPPDLDRLGEQLVSAAGGALAARRRRRRVARIAVVGALVFAALTPGPLGTGIQDGARLANAGFGPLGCEHPRGAEFKLPACDGRMVLYRPYAVR